MPTFHPLPIRGRDLRILASVTSLSDRPFDHGRTPSHLVLLFHALRPPPSKGIVLTATTLRLHPLRLNRTQMAKRETTKESTFPRLLTKTSRRACRMTRDHVIFSTLCGTSTSMYNHRLGVILSTSPSALPARPSILLCRVMRPNLGGDTYFTLTSRLVRPRLRQSVGLCSTAWVLLRAGVLLSQRRVWLCRASLLDGRRQSWKGSRAMGHLTHPPHSLEVSGCMVPRHQLGFLPVCRLSQFSQNSYTLSLIHKESMVPSLAPPWHLHHKDEERLRTEAPASELRFAVG